MIKQINSKWFISEVNYANFRYFLDDDGIWFNYKDLYDILYISGRKAEGLYNDLYEGNRRIYKDFNPLTNSHDEFKYINFSGLQEIDKQVKEKFDIIYKNINMLTNQLGLCDYNNENSLVFKTHVDMVLTEINSGERDYDRLAFYAKSVCESKEVQKLKHRKYDSQKEEIIEEFRNDIYDNDVDEITWNVVKRRDNDEFEETEKLYKKNRAENKESTCPSWLRYIVK